MKRLTPAKVMLLMFMVIGGLIVAYVGKSLLAEPPRPSKPIIDIPMALTDLEPGTLLTEKLIGLGHFDARELEWDMVKKDRIIIGRIVKERIPMGRYGKTDEISATVAFLASEGAGYITGQVLPVNGGMYM